MAGLAERLQAGAKSLVGNKGSRRYLKCRGDKVFAIDRQKVKAPERFDAKRVLRSNWYQASARELALRYKDLLRVEAIFRAANSVLEPRPVHHKRDETIRGHVFCSFPAPVPVNGLADRPAATGVAPGPALRSLQTPAGASEV